MSHTTATSVNASAQVIQNNFFKSVAEGGRGWKSAGGYAFMIDKEGAIHWFHPDSQATNGTLRNATANVSNANTLHFAYIGGREEGEITEAQKQTVIYVLQALLEKYPNARFLGHNQVSNKLCPSYSVPKTLQRIGFETKNIHGYDRFGTAKRLNAL